MFYTHAEAVTKECPLRSTKNQPAMCTGTACIAWAWSPEHTHKHIAHPNPQPDWLGYCTELIAEYNQD